MDEQTRYRVTGSLFLLAVAVIVLPMLFDGGGMTPVNIAPISVPEQSPVVVPLNEVAPDSDVMERVAEFRLEVDNEGYLRDSGTRFGEPVLTEIDPNTRVWAVQVASFADSDRAFKLRDELRSDGHDAFLSSHKSGIEVLTRVAVGPFLSEADADTLRIRISEERSLQARIVAFSN